MTTRNTHPEMDPKLISPRACVALSFLGTLDWLRDKLRRIFLRRSRRSHEAALRQHATLFLATFTLFLCAAVTLAQAQLASAKSGSVDSACSEQSIRDSCITTLSNIPVTPSFGVALLIHRLSAKRRGEEASRKMVAEGPMKKTIAAEHPHRIVVSGSGEMAYEYGSGDVSFADRETGKTESFQAGYSRVWKTVDGACRVAALMLRPMESTWKSE